MLLIKANDTYAEVVSGGVIPTGSVKSKAVVFELSEHWDGYTVIAQFTGSGTTMEIVDIKNGVAYFIPWECLAQEGSLKIALYGINGEKMMPVIYTYAEVRHSGLEAADMPQDPSPTVYEQLVAKYNESIQLYVQANEKVDTFVNGYVVSEADRNRITQYAHETLTGEEILSKINIINTGPTQSQLSVGSNGILALLVLPSEGDMETLGLYDTTVPSGKAVKDYIQSVKNEIDLAVEQNSSEITAIHGNIGDIGTALDSILAMENGLIGGEGV